MVKSDIQRVRRENLRRLADKHGGVAALGRRLGHSSGSYISQMILGSRPITEKTARAIEEELKLEQWALDRPPGEPIPFTGTDRALIAEVILAVERELDGFRGVLSAEKKARLVAEVYEHSVPLARVDRDYLIRLIQLLA